VLAEIRSFWIGSRLSKIERLCIRSFLDHGHRFVLFTYGNVDGIPPGTTIRDANELIPERGTEPFVRRGSLAHFADWFRWELLLREGGFWVDLDVVCLRPFDFSEDIVFGYQHDDTPVTGVLRFPARLPAVEGMVDLCRRPNRFRPEDPIRIKRKKLIRWMLGNSPARLDWAEAGGPIGFKTMMLKHDLMRFCQPYTVFYPVHHVHFRALYDGTFARDDGFFADTRAVHLWNEVTRRYTEWDKDSTFHPDSLVERLKRKHGV